jgi:acid phosphatase type 7
VLVLALSSLPLIAQQTPPAAGTPTFTVPASALSSHIKVIAYGDQRFHNGINFEIADPKARVALVEKIAKEKPDAVQMSGDVPYKGTDPDDYACYSAETKLWRDAQLRVYPALGNHELSGGVEKGIAEWWKAFPELKGMRWYSVALGDRISLIQLDSTSDLVPGSKQIVWLRTQLAALPPTVDFVMISMHHPPVADVQTQIHVDHNPRPNEIALRDFLTKTAPSLHAAIVVIAGHIHNYERAEVGGITYLVSGGGGAQPYQVERTAQDLYKDTGFPNFHYVRFELDGDQLKATMVRLSDPDAKKLVWQDKDHFVIHKK